MADITGTNQNDVIVGTADADTINSGNGNDTIDGGAGDDTIDGGNGNDIIDGGAGDDTIDAGNGNDIIIEEINVNRDGVDFIDGENGFDTLRIILTQQQFEKLQVAIDAFNELTDIQKKTMEFSFGDILEANSFDRSLFDVTVINVQALDIQLIANTGPTANNDENTIFADDVGTVSDNVLENDTDPDFLDDLDVISITGFSGSDNTPGNGLTVSGQFGTLTVDPETGAYTYDLDNNNAQVIALPEGQMLEDQFTYTITDEAGEASTATLTITIIGVNDPPEAMDDMISIDDTINAMAVNFDGYNILDNDTNPDVGDTKTVVDVDFVSNLINQAPAGNSLNVNQLFVVADAPMMGEAARFSISVTGALANEDRLNEVGLGNSPEIAAILIFYMDGTVELSKNNAFDFLPIDSSLLLTFNYTMEDSGMLQSSANVILTITGTDNRDVFVGTIAADIFNGGVENDYIVGNGGADTLNGGGGDDYLVGNDGSDTLNGDDGDDTLVGGGLTGGTKILNGGAGIDTLIGGENNSGTYTLNGDSEDDILTGESNGQGGVYTLNGGTGNDTLTGNINSSNGSSYTLNGGSGEDTLTGGDQLGQGSISYTLNGGDDNDTLTAGSNNINNSADKYKLFGGDGDDNLETGEGNHVLDGGADSDTAIYHGDVLATAVRNYVNGGMDANAVVAAASMLLNYDFSLIDSVIDGIQVDDLETVDTLDDGTDLIVADVTTPEDEDSSSIEWINFNTQVYALINGVEELASSMSDNEAIIGIADSNLIIGGDNLGTGTYALTGGALHDILIGGELTGPDDGGIYTISGEGGNDLIIAGSASPGGDYTLNGGEGNDIIIGGNANALGSYTIHGNNGNDILMGGNINNEGPYEIFGDSGDDTIVGGNSTNDGNYILHGNEGNDTITGGNVSFASYEIHGDSDNDTITGGVLDTGSYTLNGDAGEDTLTGGA